ncbi:prephenate dehydrogenase [Luoshenia tenuis]|jgi:prephenate dehydrogenase|uniref:prephenate dehydrogenase n=1 Tax=Luoshenia tenuis TaxID=2763654 RepID=UPI003D926D9D
MKITIVGLGVVGGSMAMALAQSGKHRIYGVDVDEATLDKAREMGIIEKEQLSLPEKLGDSELVILSIYPRDIAAFMQRHGSCLKPGTVVTDVAGIKGRYIDRIQAALPEGVDFVFGHPMAGREKRGIDFATAAVFQGANYILTPTPRNREESLCLVEALAREMGCKRVRRITPAFHDEIIAFTSQLTHAISVALVNSDIEGRDTGSFIGDSYRDLTRIANINPDLWSELFLGNKEYLLGAIENFEAQLDIIKDAVRQDDGEALRACFEKSSRRRQNLDV